MVKNILSGLLKKGDKAEANAQAGPKEENIPDELPSLAEDLLGKDEEPGQKEIGPKEEKAPEELPPIDMFTEQKKPAQDAPMPEKEDVKPPELENLMPAPESKAEAKEEPAKTIVPDEAKAQKIGFFANLLELLKKHEGSKEKLLSGDLFSRMNNYYEMKKIELKAGKQLPTQQRLEEDLRLKLEEMETLEQRWQAQKLALEEDIRFLHEREKDIQLKAEELRRVSNELNLFLNVKPEEYFYLNNGIVLKSLHDLVDVLEVIDDGTFHHHVNGERNDFSEWVKQIFKDKSLSEKINAAKTKAEIIEVLETETIIPEAARNKFEKIIPPGKYFWLGNGVVIKNLYELSDALKIMSDSVFEKHVNTEKNDFADWVKGTLDSEELGRRLKKASTKQEMANILDIYL